MTALLGFLLLVALAVLVALVLERRRAIRRLQAGARALSRGSVEVRENGLGGALDAVERALQVDRVRDERASQAAGRLSDALAAIPQGLVVFDDTGDIAYANPVADEYLRLGPQEALVGEAIDELSSRALRGGSAERQTVHVFGPPRRTVELWAVALHDGDRPAGAVVVVDDVTERRRLEAVRRDFVANISHELKTPVGALALLAETLIEEQDAAVARRLAARLLDEADRVSRMIDDLLELSRIEAGEALRDEEVPVDLFVAEAVSRVRPAAEQQRIEIEVEQPPSRLVVTGDRRQLVSATYNLLDNAVKYSEPGGRVVVRARTEGSVVDVSVRDEGPGIPERDLERIFERFYRVDRARSRETGGTGLGLAIVRHVAVNHGGDVRVRSQEGAGSTFTLRLPLGSHPVPVTSEAS